LASGAIVAAKVNMLKKSIVIVTLVSFFFKLVDFSKSTSPIHLIGAHADLTLCKKRSA
jgi:hypothetical protein